MNRARRRANLRPALIRSAARHEWVLVVGWNDALANDADTVADRYHTGAVLLSTLKDKIFKGRRDIRGYFADFRKRKPQGAITGRTIVILDNTSAVDSGTYRSPSATDRNPEP